VLPLYLAQIAYSNYNMEQSPIKIMLDDFGKKVVEAAQRNLGATRTVNGKKRRSVASGTLKESLTFENKTRYNKPILQFKAKGDASKYAKYVHDGRKPNSKPPPVEPILKWMKIKPIRLRKEGGGFAKVTEAGLRGAAFAIAKSIGKKGIPAVPYFSEAIDSELEKAGPSFILALKKEIEFRLVFNPNKKK